MSKKTYNIFDFDNTLTIKHTFAFHSRESFYDPSDDIMLAGEKDAKRNLKEGIGVVFKHDLEHLTAIATYHNNPLYIAGFVAGLLKKKLTYIETHESGTLGTAIDRYAVEGTDLPFLISYITGTDDSFTDTMLQLQKHGKNDQINALRRILLRDRLIEESSVINFYDDTPENFSKAKLLPQLNGYLIERENATFTIQEQFLYQASPIAAKVTPSANGQVNLFGTAPLPVREISGPRFGMGLNVPVDKLHVPTEILSRHDSEKIIPPVVDQATLKASIAKLNKLVFIKQAKSIKRHVRRLIKQVESIMDDKNIHVLQDVVEKTYQLLHEPDSCLNDYRATANAMKGKAYGKLQILGAIMLALGSAIALILMVAAIAGCPVAVLAPTAVFSATAFIIGGYGLFAGREKGIFAEMNKIAEREEYYRVHSAPCV